VAQTAPAEGEQLEVRAGERAEVPRVALADGPEAGDEDPHVIPRSAG
jgi:hypothetical protein